MGGLVIETRDCASQQFGAPLFQRGEYALHELSQLAHRHPTDSDLTEVMAKIRARHSAMEPDGMTWLLGFVSKRMS